MSEHVAVVKQQKSWSKLWLLPLVALVIGCWFVFVQWQNQGPVIAIDFASASGLEAGKTKIKARDVDVGIVKKIHLKEDLSGVTVTAQMSKETADMLTDKTEFWIVEPRITLSGVSGLNTLLSGSYINMQPNLDGDPKESFVALDAPPITPSGTPGLHITLNSNDEFAFKEGDAVLYKGLKVGEFEDIYFNLEERIVYYNVFIEAPYHELITSNTRFWNISGVSFELGANGLEIKTGSVETLLTNGVTFGVPEGMALGDKITDREYFDIFPDYQTASDQRYKESAQFMLLINDTVRGLKVGAPVEYRGLVVGKVSAIGQEIAEKLNQVDLADEVYEIPVIMDIQPGRIQLPDTEEGVRKAREQTMHWVKRGFRATLKTGNILTGALYVDLDIYPELAGDFQQQSYLNYPVIPTVPGEFAQLTEKVTSLLDKFNRMPLQQIGDNTNALIVELAKTSASFRQSSDKAGAFIQQIEQGDVVSKVNQTLAQIMATLSAYEAGSVTNDELNQTLDSVEKLLLDLQPLVNKLNQSPNSLVFPRLKPVEVEPKGKQ